MYAEVMAKSLNILVTGGSSGIGYFVAEQLAEAGHRVTIAARSPERARAAIASISQRAQRAPRRQPGFQQLDLASLASIETAAEQLLAGPKLDVVIANAGVVHHPAVISTSDGYEVFFGTNHLGHFALLARLFPMLQETAGARIVHLGSLSHLWAKPRLNAPGSNGWFSNYQNSKLAVMQFGFELDRRLREHQLPVHSVVAHPGNSPEQYTPARPVPAKTAKKSGRLPAALRTLGQPFCQGKDAGAWPIVHAASADEVPGGSYWGPAKMFHMVGQPTRQRAASAAYDRSAAEALWTLSATLTGVDFTF
ncbi:hypothetical protein UM93_06955 [Psychromicrobium lacuslunae]|uniref:Short-chain dehydrogenase n=2 Tax=Psychromicrobium lacuslunae TaxID=1618207 RepID=A0A0D4C2N8_9MICC|nr:hypothetical protein UM93_06955 [Psychromicrobium lacuslunae]